MKQPGNLLIVALGIAVGVGGGLLLARSGLIKWRPTGEKIRDLANASPGIQPAHAKGNLNAPVTLEEFADFQCAPCAALDYELKFIEDEYGSRLRVVFRYYPLQQVHKNALIAASAAEAADLQGHFWEMHDRLFDNQHEWAEAADARQLFIGYARELKLDAEKFAHDLEDEKTKQLVAADYRRGQSVQIKITPSIFIDGRELGSEAKTREGIRAAIDAALKRKGA